VRIVVCDVGLGNLRSVERALQEVCRGRQVAIEVTGDPAHVARADRLVMPGQGGFGECARALSGALGDAVRRHLVDAKPYLGICLGLQVLFEGSEEAPGCRGLGVLCGQVVRLAGGLDAAGAPLKIPHVGWNTAEGMGGLLSVGPAEYFYFVHSYVVVPGDRAVVASMTTYGAPFVSAIAHGSAFACQFHPEKSGQAGLRLLERFVSS
jgi:glutamine amidotransferase